MKRVLVANAKGGVGKTLISVTLAAALSNKRQTVTLADADPQASALQWIKRRSVYYPRVDYVSWRVGTAEKPIFVKKTDFVIIDAPSGIDKDLIQPYLRKCDVLVVPIMASVFDEAASRKFIIALQQIKKFRDVEIRLIPVGSRVNLRRRETTLLCDFMKYNTLELKTMISERSAYPNLARRGMSVFDVNTAENVKLQAQWRPILNEIMIGSHQNEPNNPAN